MLKFIRGKGQQPSAERQRLRKELFAYRKTVQHGFPHKPSALAFDPILKLMAIGTQSGIVKVFGRPGVEFYSQANAAIPNNSENSIQLLEWVSGTGRILSLTISNQLILWEPAGSFLVAIKTLPFDGKLKRVSSLCCSSALNVVWIGTEGGNVYQLDLKTFSIKEPVIYHDLVLEQVPSTYKLNPGAIECVKQFSNSSDKLLIAYNRGLCVLWNIETNSVIRSYVAPGHGQSVGLFIDPDGRNFTWFHADGSYATWDIETSYVPKNENYVPYGPDPCKSINNLVRGKRGEQDIIIFSGGMPRSAYGDHNCVSVHCTDGIKVCLDFTSKVIDFFVTFDSTDIQQAEILIVLLEEELCSFDLTDSAIPSIKLPYLHSVHASAVTCNHLVSQVQLEVYNKIVNAGKHQDPDLNSLEWPVNGGEISGSCEDTESNEFDILLTGHEDGSVKFWDCTGVVLKPLFHLKTAVIFGHSDLEHRADTFESLDESEPPFRKAGIFDPYSDDPRLAVKKVAFCPRTGQVIVAGTAGHIVIASFDESNMGNVFKLTTMNLVSDRDSFIWKGHDNLKVSQDFLEGNGEPEVTSGVSIDGVVQILPPAAITCIALQSEWNLLAAGTAHGLILFDYEKHHPVYHRCTLNPNDLTGAGEQLSRRKSFKKTLRESFRRLRKGRSTRNNATNSAQTNTLEAARPIERQVEARAVDDGMGSMVRCLTFAKTYITNMNTTIPTLWSGTNSSCVSVFIIHIPPKQNLPENNTNSNEPIRMTTAALAKEIQLKHRAPVIGIAIYDQAGVPLELNGTGGYPHRLLIASEEQFKVFSLPQLKPVTKYKLTAHEGARVRKLGNALFTCHIPPELLNVTPGKSKHEQHHSQSFDMNTTGNEAASAIQTHVEFGVLCLTNLGDCLVLSFPELKRQMNASVIRREDINGISSLCFTSNGQALYMMSSSELQRVSLSAKNIVFLDGAVYLEPLYDKNSDATSDVDLETLEAVSRESPNVIRNIKILNLNIESESGIPENSALVGGASPNTANETISNSVGDITVDSVRDHLNSTTTTLCSQITEDTVGRLSVLSTQTNSTVTTVNMKDIKDINIPNLKDLAPLGNTADTNTKSVVIKSVITSFSQNTTNGEHQTETTHKESQL